MPVGRPPKPIEQKRLLGNPGKRALPAPIVALAPVMRLEPAARASTGAELVAALLQAGASTWVATTDQLGLLALLADGWDERARLRDLLDLAPPADGTAAELRSWRKYVIDTRRDLRDLEKQITSWLSLLGLTPTDRSRLGVAQVKAATTLETLRTRRASRAGHRAG
jgi:hypothetical protein